jgi:hypothetical protein
MLPPFGKNLAIIFLIDGSVYNNGACTADCNAETYGEEGEADLRCGKVIGCTREYKGERSEKGEED